MRISMMGQRTRSEYVPENEYRYPVGLRIRKKVVQ